MDEGRPIHVVAAGVTPAVKPGILPGGNAALGASFANVLRGFGTRQLLFRAAGRRPLRQARRPTLRLHA
jgi:hypothetical protein